MKKIQGSIVAIVTPFTVSGEIDIPALRGLVDMHLAEGTDAIVCCGSTGEASTLDEEEKVRVYRETIERAQGRIPVIAGVFSNCTRTAKRITHAAKACGADACLVIVPYFNRPTLEGLKGHVAEIADVGLPMIFYNHPSRTSLHLSIEHLVEICENPMISAIKEGSCDLNIVQQFMRFSDKPLFSGDDILALPQMAAGASGVISIVANVIPRLWHDFTRANLDCDIQKARTLYAQAADLCHALILETNPQCVKYALSLMGKCEPAMRLPMVVPREKTRDDIRNVMEKMGLGLTLRQKAHTPEETCSV